MGMTGINAKSGPYYWESEDVDKFFGDDELAEPPEQLEVIGVIVANHTTGEGAIFADPNQREQGIVKADIWGDVVHDAERLYRGAVNQAFVKP